MPEVVAPPLASEAGIPAPRPVAVKPTEGPPAQAPVLSGKPPGRIPGEQPREKGKFVSPNGTKPEAAKEPPKPAEPVKEPYRFKREVVVYGQKENVDLDEDGLEREARELRAFRKRFKDADEKVAKALRLDALAKEDPETFLREAGIDPDEWAQKRVAGKVQLETMTEQERAAHELKQENARLKAEAEKRQKTEAQAAKEASLQKHREKNVRDFTEGLKAIGEPITNEMLYWMTQVKRDGLENGREYTPKQLAEEARFRMGGFADKHFGAVDGPALDKKLGPHFDRFLASFTKPDPKDPAKSIIDGDALAARLGDKVVEALLDASVRKWESSQSFEPKPEDPPAPAPREEEKPREYIDEQEINRRKRALFG